MLFDQMIMFNDAHDGVLGESPNLKNSFTPGGNVCQFPPEGALLGAAIQVVLTPITPYAAQAIIVKNVLTLDKETKTAMEIHLGSGAYRRGPIFKIKYPKSG